MANIKCSASGNELMSWEEANEAVRSTPAIAPADLGYTEDEVTWLSADAARFEGEDWDKETYDDAPYWYVKA